MIKTGSIIIAALIVALLATIAGFRYYMQIQTRDQYRIETANGIEEATYVGINGTRQWISIRGQDRSNPVLLFIHGGPGFPLAPLGNQFSGELEKYFVVVQWDQPGSGKSYAAAPKAADINVARLAKDAAELATYLSRRFDQPKIFLAGHSFGSAVGAFTARDNPDLIAAYIGIAQIVDARRMEQSILNYVRDQARILNNQEALDELGKISLANFTPADIFTTRKWLGFFGGDIVAEGGLSSYMSPTLFYPEYSWGDFFRFVSGGSIGTDAEWWQQNWLDGDNIIDLINQVPKLEMPVLFFLGRNDRLAPTELALEYLDKLEAPSKQIFWLENSAHWPFLEEPERFQQLLINALTNL